MALIFSKLQAAGAYVPGANTLAPTLRATPPSTGTEGTRRVDMLGSMSVKGALISNALDLAGTPVAPTGSALPNVGAPGSDGNAGQIGGASGNVGYFIQTFANFEAQHPGLGMLARIGLPVAGVFAWTKGHRILGGAAILAAVPLWWSHIPFTK